MKFTANYNERLEVSKGNEIINNGKKLGESIPSKDSYWSVYIHNEEYFISLNDQEADVWEADKEDAENYNEIPC